MAEFNIVFDQERYEPADVVYGRVIVDVDKSADCRELNLDIFWRTHGRGDSYKGEKTQYELARNERWQEGGRYEYPFQFVAPSGPFSFEGKYLNVSWSADIDAKFNGKPLGMRVRSIFGPDARETFVIAPPDNYQLRISAAPEQATAGTAVRGVMLLFFIIFGGTFGLAGSGALLIGLWTGEPIVSIIGAVFVLASLITLGSYIRRRLVNRLIDRVEWLNVRHDPQTGRLECEIEVVSRRSVRLEQLTAKLLVQERTINSGGTSSTTYKQTIHEAQWETTNLSLMRPPETKTVAPVFHIPLELPPSFHHRNNHVEWVIQTRVVLNRWLAHTLNLHLQATAVASLRKDAEWGWG